jgi:hypothetical protein
MDSVRSISGIARTSTGQPLAITIIINDHTPSVRELKASMLSLVSKIEGLGALKLRPVVVQKKAPPKRQPAPRGRSGRHRHR